MNCLPIKLKVFDTKSNAQKMKLERTFISSRLETLHWTFPEIKGPMTLDEMKNNIKLTIKELNRINDNTTILVDKDKVYLKSLIKNLEEKKQELKKLIKQKSNNHYNFRRHLTSYVKKRCEAQLNTYQNTVNEKNSELEQRARGIYEESCSVYDLFKKTITRIIEDKPKTTCGPCFFPPSVIFTRPPSPVAHQTQPQCPVAALLKARISDQFVDNECLGKWQDLANKILSLDPRKSTIYTEKLRKVYDVFCTISQRFDASDLAINIDFQQIMLKEALAYLQNKQQKIHWLHDQYKKHDAEFDCPNPTHGVSMVTVSNVSSLSGGSTTTKTGTRFGSFSAPPSSYGSVHSAWALSAATTRANSPINAFDVKDLEEWIEEKHKENGDALLENPRGLQTLLGILESMLNDLRRLKTSARDSREQLVSNLLEKKALYLDIEKHNNWLKLQFDEFEMYGMNFGSKYSELKNHLNCMKDCLNQETDNLDAFQNHKKAYTNALELLRQRLLKKSLFIEDKYEQLRAQDFLLKMKELDCVTLGRLLSVSRGVVGRLLNEEEFKRQLIKESNKEIKTINSILKTSRSHTPPLPILEGLQTKNKLSDLQNYVNELKDYKAKLMHKWCKHMHGYFDATLMVPMLQKMPEFKDLVNYFIIQKDGYVTRSTRNNFRYVTSEDVLKACNNIGLESSSIMVSLKKRQGILDEIDGFNPTTASDWDDYEDQLNRLINVQEDLIHEIFFSSMPRYKYSVQEGLSSQDRCVEWLNQLQYQKNILKLKLKGK